MTKENVKNCLEDRAETKPSSPRPLVPDGVVPAKYPVDALGANLASAVHAIAEKYRAAPTMCAHSVLTCANLAAQSAIDVRMPFGDVVPVSLYFLTSAESGERKSQCDKAALSPLRKYAASLRDQFEIDVEAYLRDLQTFESLSKRIEKDRKLNTREAMNEALTGLGDKPKPPPGPELIFSDVTTEGLQKSLKAGQANVVLTTDEGAIFLGGHAMNRDNALKTMGFFANLWSDGEISVSRSMEGNLQLSGKRLTAHIMVQPRVVQSLLDNPLAREQGFLARFLTAAPAPKAGTRFFRDTAPKVESAIAEYENAVNDILGNIDTNNVERRVVGLSDEAKALWVQFYDRVEVELAVGGKYAELKPIAGRMPEQVIRIATTIGFIADPDLEQIDADVMHGAISLGEYYLAEAVRLYQGAEVDLLFGDAEELRQWLIGRETNIVTKRELMQLGPNRLRNKKALDRPLQALIEHGWLLPIVDHASIADGSRSGIKFQVCRS